MFTLEQKIEHLKESLRTGGAEDTKFLLVDEADMKLGGVAGLKERVIAAKDRFCDHVIVASMDLQSRLMSGQSLIDVMSDDRAEAGVKSLVGMLVGAVVVVKLSSTMLPRAAEDWKTGEANFSDPGDKSTWKTGGSLIPVLGVLIVAGFLIRAMGK